MSPKGYLLREDDLHPLSLGAALLGTGGGGNPYIGMLRTRQLIRSGHEIRIIDLDTLPDDAFVGEVGGIGAPVVGIEKFEEGHECYLAMRAVEEAAGVRMSALISAEIGGSNSLEPIIAAAYAGLPVLDGDGMGRAFPEVQMTTFFIYGAPTAPGAIADEKGNVVVFRQVIDMFWLERFARDAAVAMGATAGLASAPMTMEFVRRTAVPGTVSEALRIGHTILEARRHRHNVIEAVLKITDVRRELSGGFARGHAILSGLNDFAGSEARIAIQNENLVLWVDGEPRVMVPDLIVNLDLDTGEPITTEVLRYGQRVAVLGLPVHPLMKTEKALEVVGPKAFGYPELAFTPIAASPAPAQG